MIYSIDNLNLVTFILISTKKNKDNKYYFLTKKNTAIEKAYCWVMYKLKIKFNFTEINLNNIYPQVISRAESRCTHQIKKYAINSNIIESDALSVFLGRLLFKMNFRSISIEVYSEKILNADIIYISKSLSLFNEYHENKIITYRSIFPIKFSNKKYISAYSLFSVSLFHSILYSTKVYFKSILLKPIHSPKAVLISNTHPENSKFANYSQLELLKKFDYYDISNQLGKYSYFYAYRFLSLSKIKQLKAFLYLIKGSAIDFIIKMHISGYENEIKLYTEFLEKIRPKILYISYESDSSLFLSYAGSNIKGITVYKTNFSTAHIAHTYSGHNVNFAHYHLIWDKFAQIIYRLSNDRSKEYLNFGYPSPILKKQLENLKPTINSLKPSIVFYDTSISNDIYINESLLFDTVLWVNNYCNKNDINFVIKTKNGFDFYNDLHNVKIVEGRGYINESVNAISSFGFGVSTPIMMCYSLKLNCFLYEPSFDQNLLESNSVLENLPPLINGLDELKQHLDRSILSYTQANLNELISSSYFLNYNELLSKYWINNHGVKYCK